MNEQSHYHVVAKTPFTLNPVITRLKPVALDCYHKIIDELVGLKIGEVKATGFRCTTLTNDYNVKWFECSEDCLKE